MRFVFLIACLFCVAPVRAEAEADRKQLARECDELISRAVRRPYGWAWADAAPDLKPKGGAQVVNMRPGYTPAAAFALYWAGEELGETRYKEAAFQAARGLCAAQRSTGASPARPTFLPEHAGGREDTVLVADRAPTYAAAAVWLTLVEEDGGKEDFIHASAMRSVNWLLHQQAVNGSWPQGDPPATQPRDALRILRLDNGDWRDGTLTMLLAHDVCNDVRCAKSVERSNEILLRLRIGETSPIARHLWATAYGMNLSTTNRLGEFPPRVDVLASRKSMETLLATLLVLGEAPVKADDEKPTPAKAIAEAAADVGKLPVYDHLWLRRYDFDVQATRPPPPRTPVGFEKIGTLPPPALLADLWGMDRLLPRVAAYQKSGREGLVKQLNSEGWTLHQRFAATLCGLSDEPFALAGPLPEVSEKTADSAQRIWQLVIRIKAEEH